VKLYRKKLPTHLPSLAASQPLRCALNLAILAILYPAFSYANPDGAQVVSGQVSIDTATPGVTTITNSPNAIINWQNFSIAQNELTRFIQENGQSAVLNRIIGQNPSEILGQLTSNGKVFLINPNGVVFGAGAVIDTQGLVASSLNLSDQDFLSGNYHFMAGSSAGNITNEGIIRAGKDGNIILIAPHIENNGIIKSDGGSITLAAGQELTITNLDSPDIRFQIQAPADSVLNLGKLLSEGGAINVFAGTITHSGEINADSVQVDQQGHIQLVAQQDITLTAGSKLSANNSRGDAGTIHIDSKNGATLAQGSIEAQSASGKGGHIEVLGERVGVLDQARIDASGENGGGQVLIGGDYQGKNAAVHNAKATYIDQNTTIKADAKTTGDGGKIIVWSDNDTRIHGSLSAQGGSQSGNGGFIETSGKNVEIADTARVNAVAPHGTTGTWLIDPLDFTISAGSDAQTSSGIGATTLSNLLGSANITIVTDSSTAGNGDIFVNSAVSWSANLLTLSAHRNIDINANLNGSGAAQLALKYGQSTAINSLGSNYKLNNGAQINLSAGSNFSTQSGYDGAIKNYTVINSLGAQASTSGTDLQGMNGGRTVNYVLGSNIDASATSTWNSTEGFMPIGGASGAFSGTFDGLGHTISNLTINRPSTDYVGLFGYVDTGATIRNVGLVNASVTGQNTVGGLVGWNSGTVSNSYAGGSVDGNQNVGGLVGSNPGGTIDNSYATADVTGSADNVGGLVGWNSGTVSNSYATGIVSGLYYIGGLVGYGWTGSSIDNSYATGNVNGDNYTGGLVGYNKSSGNIDHSYATGTVTGKDYTGGLVGSNYGSIDHSYATGDTNGSNYTGGLVGDNAKYIESNTGGTITNSYATGNVSGSAYVGGLAGGNSGSIGYSYATGNVNGEYETGGLVGVNDGTISYSYATGSVTGYNEAGGLAGENYGTISYSYATGHVACPDDLSCGGGGGGLVGGGSEGGEVFDSYWDAETTGWSTSFGSADSYGKTTAEMKTMATFAGWDIANTGGSSAVWRIYEGNTSPLLRNFLTSLTITANSASQTYNGSAYSGGNGVTYSIANPALSGSLVYGGTSQGAVNAGSYTIDPSGYFSSQQGYDISYTSASLTITPALLSLSVTADNATRVYGDANPTFTGTISAGGLASGDTLSSIGLTFTTLATSLSNVGSYAITPTITNSNYTFTGIDGQLTITPHALNIAAIAASKTYGDSDPTLTYNATGFVNGESSSVLTGALARTAGETVSGGPYAINQGSLANSNYSISYTGATLTINPLDSVAWVGGNGNWSTAGNWANNILPTTGNVLAVTIPTGATVTYDSVAGDTALDSLSSLGHFQMTGGNLGIGGSFSTDQYTQSGGNLGIGGNFSAAQYTQSGGSLSADGFNVTNSFNQTGGVLTANTIIINAINTINQDVLATIKTGNLTANSGGDVSLAGSNLISGVLDISAGGNIYSRTEGVSQISSLSAPNGWIDVENIGGFILGSNTVNQGVTVANAAGNIMIKAKSPLTVNGAVTSAGGSVSLTASNGDTLAINAPISAAKGVTLTGGKLTGSNAGSYLQYFNTGTSSSGNTLTDSISDIAAVIMGTSQQEQGQSSSNSNSTGGYGDSDIEKEKKAKQCVK